MTRAPLKSTEVKRDEAVDGDEAASLKGAADDTSLKVTARKHQIALERLRGLLLAETVKTPATGRGATRPDPMYTIRPNVGAVARPTPSTGRTIADGNAAYKLQLGVEGALFKLHRMLPATVKRLCPFGVADLDDMPGGAHNDTLHRLDADDAVYGAVVACFRVADADGEALKPGVVDGTYDAFLDDRGAELGLSPIDVLWGIIPHSAIALGFLRSVFVSASETPEAVALRACLENLCFTHEGKLSVAESMRLVTVALAAAGDRDEDADWHLLMMELLGAVAEASTIPFVAEGDGETLNWSEWAQRVIDEHGARGRKPYSRAEFTGLMRSVLRFGKAQGKRERAQAGAVGGRARNRAAYDREQRTTADNVRMVTGRFMLSADDDWLAGTLGGRGEGRAPGSWGSGSNGQPALPYAGWGPWSPPLGAEVRYVGGICTNAACGASINASFALCSVCHHIQGNLWTCSSCNLPQAGDGGPGGRCRHGFGSGCPGTFARGRRTTSAEIEIMKTNHTLAREPAAPGGQLVVRAKGKGQRVMAVASGGPPYGGVGNPWPAGDPNDREFVRVLQALVDRTIASPGGTRDMTPNQIQEALAAIRRPVQVARGEL